MHVNDFSKQLPLPPHNIINSTGHCRIDVFAKFVTYCNQNISFLAFLYFLCGPNLVGEAELTNGELRRLKAGNTRAQLFCREAPLLA